MPTEMIKKEEEGIENERQEEQPQSTSPLLINSRQVLDDASVLRWYLALWATTTTTSADPAAAGIATGSIVFAPLRKGYGHKGASSNNNNTSTSSAAAGRPHYALAEVTGVQVAEGTVSIAFLFTDPGVDDEAISLFEVIPCPPALLARLHPRNAAAVPCTLVERLLGVAPWDGPVNVGDAFRSMLQPSPPGAVLRDVYCLSGEDEPPRDGGHSSSPAVVVQKEEPEASAPLAVEVKKSTPATPPVVRNAIAFRYEETTLGAPSPHAFYAKAFHDMNEMVEANASWLRNGQRRSVVAAAPVVLSVFDSYATLRRFEVFMSLRGHLVRLLDGEEDDDHVATAKEAPQHASHKRARDEHEEDGNVGEAAVPTPAVRHAFGTTCKVWLCMLRDDVVSGSAITAMLRRAPPADHLLCIREGGDPQGRGEKGVEMEDAILVLHPRLRRDVAHRCLTCTFHSLPPSQVGGGMPKIKVSGNIFGDRKVLVPASGEQLFLVKTVLAGPSPPRSAAVTLPLGANLLERIALGNFADTALQTLFDGFSPTCELAPKSEDAPPPVPPLATMASLRCAFLHDPSQFGEAFPVFAAAKAIINDVFAEWREAAVVCPRIALVVPRGNPTGNPQLAVRHFLAQLRQFLAPWHVYEVTLPVENTTAAAAPVLWQRGGGVLLLHSDEPTAHLGALHREADVVIACGKSASAWVAANSASDHSDTYFAVLSEIDVVTDTLSHTWTPWSTRNVPPDPEERKRMVKDLLETFLASERNGYQNDLPRVLQHVVALWRRIVPRDATQAPPSPLPGQKDWQHLKQFLQQIILNSATASPVHLGELELQGERE